MELSVARFARTKTKQLTARGPGSTECTASLRKSAEPAYWPRRGPALGQRCTRAGERSAGGRRHSAGRRRLPNLPKHTSPDPQMPQYPRKGAIRAGFQICVITSWRYMGLAGTRGRIVIKQSNAAQKSKNQNPTNTTFPSHSFSESKQYKIPGKSRGKKRKHCVGTRDRDERILIYFVKQWLHSETRVGV